MNKFKYRTLGFNKFAETEKKKLTNLQSIVAGGAAGALGTTIAYPLDSIATMKQTGTWATNKKELKRLNSLIGKTKYLFGGMGWKLIKVVPATAVTFATFNLLKNKLTKK